MSKMTKKIFIIDDDDIYRLIVSKMLEKFDTSLSIEQCENGENGLEILESHKATTDTIIIILDINMPRLEGWGFLNELEKNNFYDIKKLSIYIVTSSTDDDDIVKSKNFKFIKHFFHKPLSKQNIKLILDIVG